MSISSVNTKTGFFQSQPSTYKANDNTLAKRGAAENARLAETANKTATNAVAATASSAAGEKTTKLDFENITPKETYDLAVKLIESESISLSSYVRLMAIGLQNEHTPGQEIDTSNPNTAPFNLLKELEAASAGTKSDNEALETLLDILFALPEEMQQAKYVPIDINV